MKSKLFNATILLAIGLAATPWASPQERDGIFLSKDNVSRIRAELGNLPLFDDSLRTAVREVEAEMQAGIDTPVPRDLSGGYTHERHKQNYFAMQKAGALFQILDDERYARYVRDMLFQYEAMYPNLPLHPQTRSYARGKLFWQCLNDANWLVFASHAYDAIYHWLSEDERQRLETNLFRPFADHLSVDNPQFFNRIHNHSTWGAAAVGMIGLVMGDEELIQRALYGLENTPSPAGARDNDGGFIRLAGQQAGFFANLDEPFSPNGYYTEGPYYQRYAMYPFLVFAQALNAARPDLGVLDYKDGVLLKAVDVLLNFTDADGEFFPLNDAQKGMSYHANELVTAVGIAWHQGGQDPRLLSIARQQGRVLLDDTGYGIAVGIREGLAQEFTKVSASYGDGANGDEGGLSVMRTDNEELALVFKYTAQGLSHGHYDKLSFSLYGGGDEILQDYGMSRFVNIGQKGGGNYLPENTTWAKQTIAHNTLVLDETSHFGGQYETGSQHHSELHFARLGNSGVQVASARETNAYPGTELLRTLALIQLDELENPFVLDLFKVNSSGSHQYDLPFHYLGHVLQTSFDYETPQSRPALGSANGYQHLIVEGIGGGMDHELGEENSRGAIGGMDNPPVGNTRFAWMNNRRFFTLTTISEPTDELLMVRLGANDPDFNLRRDPAFILRRPDTEDTLFVSTIETHGSYDPVTELAQNTESSISNLEVLLDDNAYTVVSIETASSNHLFLVSNLYGSDSATHELTVAGESYRWTGPFHLVSLEESSE